MYFNGLKVHTNQPISQVWGGPNSGLDGGNDDGRGITDTPGGLTGFRRKVTTCVTATPGLRNWI